MAEENQFEDLILAVFSNQNGDKLMAELELMYLDRPSYVEGMVQEFDEVAFREGQRSIILKLKSILNEGK